MKLLITLVALFVTINASSDRLAWAEFKTQHSRNYKHLEERLRFQYFQKNLRKIEEHNAKYEKGESSYFLKVTKFADWSDEEFRSMLKNQASTRPVLNNTLDTFKADPNFKGPSSFDWRDKNAVLDVLDQGACGACWTFSTTGALEGQLAIHQDIHTPLSQQELIDCDNNTGDKGCAGGLPNRALDYVKEHGISSDEDYPYEEVDFKCRRDHSRRLIKSLSEVKFVDKTEEALVQAIASIGPIAVSLDAATWSFYGGGIYDDVQCGTTLTHAVVGIGYTPDYIIIKNSWGQQWGEQGFIKLKRGHNICGINNAFNCYGLL